jgi:CopG family transcriptional regulator, nickel-responsive regulator
MERITISLDEDLAREFDALAEARGYQNRSEAIRDLLRREVEAARQIADQAGHCVANLSYVFNHHERDLAERLNNLQHDHHDLTVATMHAHLDHDHCLESVILKGPTKTVRSFSEAIIAERGVRHGLLNVVSVSVAESRHNHGYKPLGKAMTHTHLKPKG